jgi:hypothetical protein
MIIIIKMNNKHKQYNHKIAFIFFSLIIKREEEEKINSALLLLTTNK